MSYSPMVSLLEFHKAFEHGVSPYPTAHILEKRKQLRIKLMLSELSELVSAIAENDIIEIADGIGDLLYVVYGTALEYGIDAEAVFNEVHRSNMTKLGEDGKPIQDASGKSLKGPNFEPPRIAELLRDLGCKEILFP